MRVKNQVIGFIGCLLICGSVMGQTYRQSDPNVSVETMHRIDLKVEKLRTGGYRVTPTLENYQEGSEDNKDVETMLDMGAILGRTLFCQSLDENCLSARNILPNPTH